uniref:Putative methyltransferase n=1 Tax=viral metagenome TaxID=1070528 RepID=A0A6H1Z9Y7_9ZZZZ
MSLPTPYYDHAGIVIYNCDCREILPLLEPVDLVLFTDPPYGIAYVSGMTGHHGGIALPGIAGDEDTSLRDSVLAWYGDGPAVVFGTWKRPRPGGVKAMLTWEKGDHLGMGDLAMPWKPNAEEVYILGSGFSGHRGTSVLRYNAQVSWNSRGREHPHEKPIPLLYNLMAKCPPGIIFDPFAGSCTTLVAAKQLNRRAIGVEIEEEYCRVAVRRLSQEVFDFGAGR